MKFKKLLKKPFFNKEKIYLNEEKIHLKSNLKIVNDKFKKRLTIFITLIIIAFFLTLILYMLDKSFYASAFVLTISLFPLKGSLEASEQSRSIKELLLILENDELKV